MEQAAEAPVLEIEHLGKKRKGFVLRDINITLESGYIMGLIGRNGAGKTTIIQLILNSLCRNSGTIKINGWDNRKKETEAKNDIGFVVDDAPFFQHLSLEENGDLFGKFYKRYCKEKFQYYMKQFQLDKKLKLGQLSRGMLTKFQIAFALAHSPKLLLMDEPNAGFDPIFRRYFLTLLRELTEKDGMGILFSTHITADLDKIADYITMIDRGELIFSRTKEEMKDRYRIIRGDTEKFRELPPDFFVSVRRLNKGFEGMVDRKKSQLSLLEKYGITSEEADLENIMFYISRRREHKNEKTIIF